MGSPATPQVRRELLRVAWTCRLARLPFFPVHVLVHVPVHVPVHDLCRDVNIEFLVVKPHGFLVYGNVNRFAVNVYVSRPTRLQREKIRDIPMVLQGAQSKWKLTKGKNLSSGGLSST